MAQFGVTGKNPPWVRNTGAAISGSTAQLLVQTATQAAATPTAVAQQTTAYNAGLATLRLAQVGLEQPCRDNVFLVQNTALQPGAVLSQTLLQPGVAIPTSLTTTNVGAPGIALPTSLSTGSVATVSYPTPRSLHPSQSSQFSNPAQAAIQSSQQQQQQHSQVKQRVFTGTVSKMHDNFGFVDDDVFFQITCVKGALPKVGDRVLVEATYNPNMPFKWNAARIQLLPNQVQASSSQPQQTLGLRSAMMSTNSVASNMGSNVLNPQIAMALAAAATAQSGNSMSSNLSLSNQSYNQVPPPSQAVIHAMGSGSSNMNRLPSLMGTRRHSPPAPPPMRREREREREPRRDDRRDRERHREREHERERVPIVRKRSRSPRPRSRSPRPRSRSPRPRSRSPPRRRARITPRYVVQVPKLSLDLKEANVLELRKRYTNMYVPSDFFFSSFVWMDAFPLYRPFVGERPCHFHIVSKEVDQLCTNNAVLDPPDADHSFSAKVMLMSAPLLDELYQKCCGSMPTDDGSGGESFVHPTRLFSFLVGLKNKNETMAIGGPWSPSLDGADPRADPSVLIRTAVRTCHGLTGIDLSVCTKWYRFAEIYYHRRGGNEATSSSHRSRSGSSNVAMSSSSAGLTSASCASTAARVETVVIFLPDVWNCTPTLAEWESITSGYHRQLLQKRLPAGAAVTTTSVAEDNALPADTKDDQVPTESSAQNDNKRDQLYHSDLDPKSMKIAGLRHELEQRNLSSKGLKSQLVARLVKALKVEHDKEEEEAEATMEDEEPIISKDKTEPDEKESETKATELAQDGDCRLQQNRNSEEDREQEARDRRNYTFPDTPSLIVHPSRTAKGGRFDCTVMSLSVLLDYRPEDNKEYSFEVSLFAELFNEMLVRDYGFHIYRAIFDAPERKDVTNNATSIKGIKKETRDDTLQESKDESAKKDDKKKKDEDDKDEEAEDEEDEEVEEIDEQQEDEAVTGEKKNDENNRQDSKERKPSSHKSPPLIIDPSFLLACVYFDQNHCDYILDKDLEDILATLGLNLSRAQTRRLLQNVLIKDKFLYRKLSSRYKSKDAELVQQLPKDGDGNKDTVGNVLTGEELATGNKGLLHSLRGGFGVSNRDWGVAALSGPPTVPEEGLVIYNGALLDINKLLQQLQRNESARAGVEIAMKETQEQLTEMKEQAAGVQETNAKTAAELREVKRRLCSAEEELKVQRERSQEYMDLLRRCHDIIQPTVVQSATVPATTTTKSEEDDKSDRPEVVIVKRELLQNGDT